MTHLGQIALEIMAATWRIGHGSSPCRHHLSDVRSCVARTTRAVSIVRAFDRRLAAWSNHGVMLSDGWGWCADM
jgi:hypothetical protein